MPYNNADGIVYVDTTTTPYTGISIADVQTAVDSTRNDIGALIRNGLINKWAKYKPVKQAGLDFSSQMNSNFTWKTSADTGGPATWWKGYNGQCGLTFDTFQSLGNPGTSSSFLYKLRTGALGWGYEVPTGTISIYPYRFFDFLQYYRFAPKPVTGVYDNLRLSSSGNLTVQLDEARALNGLGIELSDLVIENSPVSGWYVGVLIWYSNSSGEYTFAFSENTLGSNGSLDVDFTNMMFFGGKNVTIVPFLASARANQGVDPGGAVYLSCDVEPQTVTIRGAVNPIDTSIDAIWASTFHERVRYAVNIINNTGNQLTISSLRISLYEDNVEVNYKTETNIVIPLDGNWSDESMLVFNYDYDSTKTYTVRVTSSSPNIDESAEVNEPRNS